MRWPPCTLQTLSLQGVFVFGRESLFHSGLDDLGQGLMAVPASGLAMDFIAVTLCSSNGFAEPENSLGFTPGAPQQCPDELDIAHLSGFTRGLPAASSRMPRHAWACGVLDALRDN
jgi:hypothetical protein